MESLHINTMEAVMTVVIPPGHSLIVHQHSVSGSTRPMNVTYGLDSVPTGSDLLDLHQAWGGSLVSIMSSSVELDTTTVYIAGGAREAYTEVIAGANAATMAPPNLAYLLNKHTSRVGRQGRGRWYIPGVAEGDVNNIGQLTAGIQSDIAAQVAEFLAFLPDIATAMVLLHSDSSDPDPVTSITVNPLAATQRRRLRK